MWRGKIGNKRGNRRKKPVKLLGKLDGQGFARALAWVAKTPEPGRRSVLMPWQMQDRAPLYDPLRLARMARRQVADTVIAG